MDRKIPTSCPICGNMVKHLSKHLRLHYGLRRKPGSCTICGVVLSRSDSVRRHMSIAHSDKSFEFHVCSKIFAAKISLSQHLKTHTKVQCNVCQKLFTEATLSYHMQKQCSTKLQCVEGHQRDKTNQRDPFQCESCKVSFLYKAELSTHIQTNHSNMLPVCNALKHLKHGSRTARTYICKWCVKIFESYKHLKSHQLIHDKHGRSDLSGRSEPAVENEFATQPLYDDTRMDVISELNAEDIITINSLSVRMVMGSDLNVCNAGPIDPNSVDLGNVIKFNIGDTMTFAPNSVRSNLEGEFMITDIVTITSNPIHVATATKPFAEGRRMTPKIKQRPLYPSA